MKHFTLLLVLILFAAGCARNVQETVYPTLHDGKYDNEFPYRNCSEQLEDISNSINMVNTIAFYNVYIFSLSDSILIENKASLNLFEKADQIKKFTRTAAGTATVIHARFGEVALLSCAHVVSFEDTLYTYHIDSSGVETKIIESISIKTRQSNYIVGYPEGGEVEVLAADLEKDIAIIGNKYQNSRWSIGNKFSYPNGQAKELEWGSFVYAFGYPLNKKVISKGIVSNPNSDGSGEFIIDAVFNPGFSGGIVLAIRDGVPNFELVGMIKSAPADYEYVLKPNVDNENFAFNPVIPYEGEIVVDYKKNLLYGLITVIPVEDIVEFIEDSKTTLSEKGYDINSNNIKEEFKSKVDTQIRQKIKVD